MGLVMFSTKMLKRIEGEMELVVLSTKMLEITEGVTGKGRLFNFLPPLPKTKMDRNNGLPPFPTSYFLFG
jgi:hypothetical protein